MDKSVRLEALHCRVDPQYYACAMFYLTRGSRKECQSCVNRQIGKFPGEPPTSCVFLHPVIIFIFDKQAQVRSKNGERCETMMAEGMTNTNLLSASYNNIIISSR